MSTILTRGIVLRSYDYKDYDRQYIIYTKDEGKVMAVGKSVKKIKSKLASHLEPFFTVELMLARGRAFYRVAGAKIKYNYANIAKDINKSIIACCYLESADALIGYHHTDKKLFNKIQKFLNLLSGCDNKNNILVLDKSLYDLLSHLGYRPIEDVSKEKIYIKSLYKMIVNITEKDIKSFDLLFKQLTQ